jgi:MFS family permease
VPLIAPATIVPVVAALFGAWLARVHGRKACSIGGCALFCFGQALLVAAWTTEAAAAARILGGGGSAMLWVSMLMEVVEAAPAAQRGVWMAVGMLFYGLSWLMGSLFAAGVGPMGDWGWRVVAAFGLWPALALLALLCFMPEVCVSRLVFGCVFVFGVALFVCVCMCFCVL